MKNKSKLDPRAVKLLHRTKKHFSKHPDSYNQANPGMYGLDGCKTPTAEWACCIVGCMEYFGKNETFLTEEQRGKLFDASMWPKKFYRRGSWKNIKPETAIKRIDHFIATDGEK